MRTGQATLWAGAMTSACLLSSIPRAHACSRPAIPLHQIDPQLARVDQEPPLAPRDLIASTERSRGTVCNQDSCTSSSCGDQAFIQLRFTPGRDDQSDVNQVGYRLDVIRGVVPESTQRSIQTAPDGLLLLSVGFEDIVTLDARATLTAIDAAGNESPSSEPFELSFSGCTTSVVSDACEQSPAAASGCSVSLSPPRGNPTTHWLPWLVGLLLASQRVRGTRLGSLVEARGLRASNPFWRCWL